MQMTQISQLAGLLLLAALISAAPAVAQAPTSPDKPIDYQAEVKKKYPNASCQIAAKAHKDERDVYYISSTPDQKGRWMTSERKDCTDAWRDAYMRSR